MKYPNFFDTIEPIRLYDPLSEFLGAIDDGIVEFSYLDVVKNAGHSCPTVAGAYLMLQIGLKALYEDQIPERGNIHVSFSDDELSGTTGVIANIFAQVLGATKENGFKGMNGKFSRVHLMDFSKEMESTVRLQRLDSSCNVALSYDPSLVDADPKQKKLLVKIMSNNAILNERDEFKTLWQKRVEDIFKNSDKVIILNKQ